MMTDPERAYVEALGLRIRLLRIARRLSQTELAATADVARSLLGSVERGDHPAGLLTYARLASALDIPLRDLIDPNSADREVLRLFGNSSD
jgi:transcriptional regulator with XRE-family HTH domain